MILENPLLIIIVTLLLGGFLGYFLREFLAKRKAQSLDVKVKKIIEEAKKKAQEEILEAKAKAQKIIEEAQKEEKERKQLLFESEKRLQRKEEVLERKAQEQERFQRKLAEERKEIEKIKKEIFSLKEKVLKRLEEVSKMSQEEAKKELLEMVEKNIKQDLVETMKKLEKERKEELEKKAAQIMSEAIQRLSRSCVSEMTTTVVPLPNEEMKGRIIGKEGRNIRTFEKLTGVDVIIDETPEIVTLSCFDPIRREIARIALEKLIKDGRIQPARIEEKVEEAKKEVVEKIKEAGENACYEVGIYDLPKEIVFLLGRLHYRTSFGQNVLQHSIEAAHLAAMLASELGLNVEVAKKAALLHDIGKALDFEVKGDHVEIGRRVLEKYGIEKEVIEAMQAHHETYPFASPEAYIVAAAEAVSAARPGARRETLEQYLKRLQDLERIATSFEGVKKAYAIRAGREVWVFVEPSVVDDWKAYDLARRIALRIEEELKYPGEIKVVVIRETKAIEYAR